MKGRFHNNVDKWFHINQLIRDERIAILALQESHLSEQQAQTLNELFTDTLLILTSGDPDHPTAKGVSIVLNKRLMNTNDCKVHHITPGEPYCYQSDGTNKKE